MPKRRHNDTVVIALEVKPRSPRLAYCGVNDPFVRPASVQSQIVEIVDPGHITVFEGGHLEYAHVSRDDAVPCDGNGDPILEPKPGGGHQYTKRAIELLSKDRRRHLRALKCK